MNRTKEDRYRITVEAFDSFQYYQEEGYLKDYLKESGFTLNKVERKQLTKANGSVSKNLVIIAEK